LLLEIEAKCEGLKGSEYVNLSWLTLENASNLSPSDHSLCRWVLDMVVENYLIHSQIIEKVQIFLHSDGGQRGQEVCLISVWNEGKTSINKPDGECEFYWLDLAYTGKKSKDVAKGM
jgi:hypothetical protein